MDDDVDNETISHFLSTVESFHHGGAGDDDPFPQSSILELISLLDADARPDALRRRSRRASTSSPSSDFATSAALWDHLATRGLPASAVVRPLSAAMDSLDSRLALLAARAYLSLFLSPSSPVYSLFTPLALQSLFRSLRRALKPASGVHSNSNPSSSAAGTNASASHSTSDHRRNCRKRKPGGGRSRKDEPSTPSTPSLADGSDTIVDLLPRVLELLDSVLSRVRLDASTDALKPLVESVVGILGSKADSSRLTDLCFRILYNVISKPEHGDQTASAVEVMCLLSPMILSSTKSPSRTSALAFVKRKIVPLSKENDMIRKALMYLPRFLAMKAPEKSEPRACAVDSIMDIVRTMEQEDQFGFVDYVIKMAQGKAQLRLLAVDIMLSLLTSLPDPFGTKNQFTERDDLWGIKCFRALLHRCSDIVGGIRARALTNIGQVIELLAADHEKCTRLKEIIGTHESGGFNELLRSRCQDDKAAVRKAALLLITKSTALIGSSIDELLLRTLGSACSDPLVSIRKAALTALSEVYRRFSYGKVISEWLHAVPCLIIDNETSIIEECENLFLELVLDRISQTSNVMFDDMAVDLEALLPKGILELLSGICDAEVEPCVKKICGNLGKKKKLRTSIATSLLNIITISESIFLRNSTSIEHWTAPPGTWQLLSEVSAFTPKAVDWKFLLHHWQLFDKVNPEEQGECHDGRDPISITWARDRVSLLQTISNVSLELPSEAATDLACSLLDRLQNFFMHLSEVDAHVKALKTLCKRKTTNPEDGDILVKKWVDKLLSKAVELLDSYVSGLSETEKVNDFLTPPQSSRRKGKKEASLTNSSLQAVTAVFTIGSLVLAYPSADLQGIIPLLHTIITSGSTEPKPKKLAGSTVSFKESAPSLYIQSWVTMGKICLVDDKLAKRYIPLFVQELERSDIAAVRNNIMVAMTDFCVRYTALIDGYIPKITKSLRDHCEVVRRQTFILLSRLLQRDYVKWKGVLFLRFLLSLVDESEKIRHLADFLFGSVLKVKAPLLAYNSFIEAIFILNDCHVHSAHNEAQAGLQSGSQLFSIRGTDEKSRSQRMHIYVSLLKQMVPEHLLATSAKLCAEILVAASDGHLNVEDVKGQSVLQDALEILACKEMRIHPTRGSDMSEMDDEVGDGGGGALAAAKGRAVTQVTKKNLVQVAVPIFIELKRLLESKNSPLTGCLMECLRALLKDYKNEIEEILVADKQLQKELLYDMQKHEAAKTKSTVAEAVKEVHRSESFRSPNSQANPGLYARVSQKLGNNEQIASAIADRAAKAIARSVLKDVNRNVPTPPLHAMSVPRLKTTLNGRPGTRDQPSEVLESLRRRQTFESDDEN